MFTAWTSRVVFRSNGKFSFDKAYECPGISKLSEGIGLIESDESIRMYVKSTSLEFEDAQAWLRDHGYDLYATSKDHTKLVGKARRGGTEQPCSVG